MPIYSAFDAGGRDANAHELQDRCSGHPQMAGQYHFHGLPACYRDKRRGRRHSSLASYALDGFGIYGYRRRRARKLSNADLDACHSPPPPAWG